MDVLCDNLIGDVQVLSPKAHNQDRTRSKSPRKASPLGIRELEREVPTKQECPIPTSKNRPIYVRGPEPSKPSEGTTEKMAYDFHFEFGDGRILNWRCVGFGNWERLKTASEKLASENRASASESTTSERTTSKRQMIIRQLVEKKMAKIVFEDKQPSTAEMEEVVKLIVGSTDELIAKEIEKYEFVTDADMEEVVKRECEGMLELMMISIPSSSDDFTFTYEILYPAKNHPLSFKTTTSKEQIIRPLVEWGHRGTERCIPTRNEHNGGLVCCSGRN